MKKYGIFYASTGGHTDEAARSIARYLNVAEADVHDVATTAPSALGEYETAILGSATYGDGAMHPRMADFIDGAQGLFLKGHRLAFFGTGDDTMTNSFCSAVGDMARAMSATEATQVGQFDARGYLFDNSRAEIAPGVYAGLLLDYVNHADLSDERIARWVKTL